MNCKIHNKPVIEIGKLEQVPNTTHDYLCEVTYSCGCFADMELHQQQIDSYADMGIVKG